MLERATGPFQLHQTDALSYLLWPGTLLKHSCGTVMPAETVVRKLEGFRLQWKADVASNDPTVFWLEVPLTNSFWQRCLGRRPAILIQITLGPHQLMTETLTGVRVEMRPVECQPEQAVLALGQYGPLLLESLRTCLGAVTERRPGPPAVRARPGRVPGVRRASAGRRGLVRGQGRLAERHRPDCPDVTDNRTRLPAAVAHAAALRARGTRPRGAHPSDAPTGAASWVSASHRGRRLCSATPPMGSSGHNPPADRRSPSGPPSATSLALAGPSASPGFRTRRPRPVLTRVGQPRQGS